MRRTWLLGMGVVLVSAAVGCGGDDAPGSTIGQMSAGSGGGGQAGSISLSLPGSGAGNGGGGAGGVGGVGGAGGTPTGSAGTFTFGGSSLGGGTSHAGSNSGTAGSQSSGMCTRANGSDADCADFYPAEGDDLAKPQAYSCTDRSAFITLNSAHGSNCASVSFVTGANTGACCPP